MDAIADTIQKRLLDLIVSGRIAPGEPIRQDRVAQDLGVSKVPLREALGRLEEMGLVESAMHRGFVAARLSREEADDLFSTRMLVEPPTAAAGCERASEGQRRDLDESLQALAKAGDGASDTALARLAMALDLLRPAGRPSIAKFVVPLFYRSERYLRRGHALSLDAASLQDLVRAWTLGRPAAVKELYEQRLAARWRAALESLD